MRGWLTTASRRTLRKEEVHELRRRRNALFKRLNVSLEDGVAQVSPREEKSGLTAILFAQTPSRDPVLQERKALDALVDPEETGALRSGLFGG